MLRIKALLPFVRVLAVLTLGVLVAVVTHHHSPARTAVRPVVVAATGTQVDDIGPRPHAASRSHVRQPVHKVHRRVTRRTHPATAKVTPAVAFGSIWDRIAQCESSGNWADTAGMYEGGLQFLNSTWLSHGGGRYAQHAYQATRSEQIIVAERVLADEGWNAWPVCSRKAGAR